MAVPLCLTDSDPDLEYALEVTSPTVAIASAVYAEDLRPLAVPQGWCPVRYGTRRSAQRS